jgi:hypothetical protein
MVFLTSYYVTLITRPTWKWATMLVFKHSFLIYIGKFVHDYILFFENTRK